MTLEEMTTRVLALGDRINARTGDPPNRKTDNTVFALIAHLERQGMSREAAIIHLEETLDAPR